MAYANFDMKYYPLILLFSILVIGMSFLSTVYGQDDVSKTITKKNANPIVYHLTSNDPWRASIAISDATNLNNLGFNVTLLLSIGVQVGVKNPHHFLNLNDVVANVTNFIKDGGKVVVCGVCLRVAGFEPNEIIDGAITGTDEITSKIFTNATVVTY